MGVAANLLDIYNRRNQLRLFEQYEEPLHQPEEYEYDEPSGYKMSYKCEEESDSDSFNEIDYPDDFDFDSDSEDNLDDGYWG